MCANVSAVESNILGICGMVEFRFEQSNPDYILKLISKFVLWILARRRLPQCNPSVPGRELLPQ